jgi:hypothetical protein
VANIRDPRTVRKLEEQQRRVDDFRDHEKCLKDFRTGHGMRVGDVFRCKHGVIVVITNAPKYYINSYDVLNPIRNPIRYRKAIRALRLEDEIARREAAAGVPEPEGEGA